MDLGAKQAREILDDRNIINANRWYEKWKYNLFEWIKNESLKGSNSMLLVSFYWNDEDYKKVYLMDQLKSLGYSVSLEDNMIKISW